MTRKKITKGNIAIPSMGKTIESLISDTLGRAPYILVYNVEDMTCDCFDNPGFKVQDGSGLKAAELITTNNVDILLTKEIGRKAYSVLMKEHIDIHLLKTIGKVKTVVKKFLN